MRPQDGVGAGVPSPRYESAASARIATANSTVACTISTAAMLGSTWRARIASGRRPAAARGEHEVATRSTTQRRAAGEPGEDRDVGDADRDHRRHRRAAVGGGEHDRDQHGGERVDDVGGAHRRLVDRAAALGGEQRRAARRSAPRSRPRRRPTSSVVRAPTMSWLRMSRPNWSAPSRWLPETSASESCGRTMVGSYGVQTSDTSAASTTRPTSTPPDDQAAAGAPVRARARRCVGKQDLAHRGAPRRRGSSRW